MVSSSFYESAKYNSILHCNQENEESTLHNTSSNKTFIWSYFAITLIRKKIDSIWGYCLSSFMFFLCLCGFSLAAPVLSHISEMYTFGKLMCLHCLNLSECGMCECPLQWKSVLSRVGSCLLPELLGERLWPLRTRNLNQLWKSRLENTYFYLLC